MRVRWTRPALGDLDRIDSYLAEQDRDFADRAGREVTLAARFLAAHPQAGADIGGIRKWTVGRGPYLLLYRVTVDTIEIVRVRHQREDWQAPCG